VLAKMALYGGLLALLSGCAGFNRQEPDIVPLMVDRPAAARVDVGIDWNWRVVGDAAVRPVQVFSKGSTLYLQMRDQRPVVLLVNRQIIPYRTSWPYLLVNGTPDEMDIAMDGYRAVIVRSPPSSPQPLR
jgi:hypothetical protein